MNNWGWEPRENQAVQVDSEQDIVLVRMEARQIARRAGLNLASQASISLATSSLAYLLGLNAGQSAEFTVTICANDGRSGVQIVYQAEVPENFQICENPFREVSWLVDELRVDMTQPNQLSVTAIKWNES